MRILSGFAVVLLTAASALGATATITDIAASDVPTPGMTVFPVPAAAGWTGPKNLIFNNSTAGLAFSAQPYPTGNAWVNFPLSNSAITIHSLVNSTSSPSAMAIGDAPGKYYTNTQGNAGEVGADNRFPYNIPRPGRDCAQDFSAIYFDLAQVTTEFGVFLPAHSNNYGGDVLNDYNYVPVTNMPLDVYVLRPGDTIATAQHLPVTIYGYSPFLKITDSAGIDGVVIRHNCDLHGGPTFGFMDVYSNVPEPATMTLVGLGLLALARRRRA